MGKVLSDAAVEQYRRDGYYFPIDVMSPQEAAGFRRRLESYEESQGGRLKSNYRHKVHLLFPWAYELVTHPKILDAVEDIMGPNLICWSTNLFAKEAHDPAFVSMHQDSTYWGLDPADVMTAWVALSDCVNFMKSAGMVGEGVLVDHVAAISCGIVAGTPVLDLDYVEDSGAETDANFVMTGKGGIVEVQGTAEGTPFSRDELTALLDLASAGIARLVDLQKLTIA